MIKKKLLEIIQNKRWNKEIKMVELRGASLLLVSELKTPILFIVPHADDELLPSWKTLSKYKDQIILYYCGMTGSNNSVKNKITRENEISLFAKEKDYNIIIPDDWKESLVDTINDMHIKYVFLPSYFDWHLEHRLIDEMLIAKHSEFNKNGNK